MSRNKQTPGSFSPYLAGPHSAECPAAPPDSNRQRRTHGCPGWTESRQPEDGGRKGSGEPSWSRGWGGAQHFTFWGHFWRGR